MNQTWDVVIIGGGINGTGIAADAASRGLSVLLIEKDDLASKTSSSSSKLIHGGLRYLEQGHFKLVKKALKEREILLNIAPHLVKPLPLVLPQTPSLRPAIMLKLGLYLYDKLNKNNSLMKSRPVSRITNPPYFNPLALTLNKGFLYFDATTDDARLTIGNALKAKVQGAVIKTRHELLEAQAYQDIWRLVIKGKDKIETVYAKVVINAAGPWVQDVNQRLNIKPHYDMRYVKGSHLVVKCAYPEEHAYLLQHTDKRVVFVIPYYGYTMIGTTEVDVEGALETTEISADETTYLLSVFNHYFKQHLNEEDIISSWSGVRPLIDGKQSSSTLSRDYVFHSESMPAQNVVVYGGKITTYRCLSEDVVNSLHHLFPNLPHSQTATSALIGDLTGQVKFNDYMIEIMNKFPSIDKTLLTRYLRQYGQSIEVLLEGCQEMACLGAHFGHGLYQREISYLQKYEWAETAEDILWRRTKLGLCFSAGEVKALELALTQLKHPPLSPA